eukprot:COSAG03_NODE_27157_length_255_cov_0.506410_1_plen_50_part_10
MVRVLKLEFAMESFGVGSWTPRVYVGGDATVWAMHSTVAARHDTPRPASL